MKALWFGIAVLVLPISACEKRRGTLLPPRDAPHQGSGPQAKGEKAANDRTEMRAKSLPEGMLEGEVGEPLAAPMNEDEVRDLQKVKQDAIDRIKRNPGEKLRGTPASRGKAAALFQRGRQLVAQGNFDDGQEYFLVACQLGYSEGCHKFGWHEERTGNVSNARQFYKIACEGGLSKSCNNLGFQLERLQQFDEALDFYARACLDRHSIGCENLKRLRADRLRLR